MVQKMMQMAVLGLLRDFNLVCLYFFARWEEVAFQQCGKRAVPAGLKFVDVKNQRACPPGMFSRNAGRFGLFLVSFIAVERVVRKAEDNPLGMEPFAKS